MTSTWTCLSICCLILLWYITVEFWFLKSQSLSTEHHTKIKHQIQSVCKYQISLTLASLHRFLQFHHFLPDFFNYLLFRFVSVENIYSVVLEILLNLCKLFPVCFGYKYEDKDGAQSRSGAEEPLHGVGATNHVTKERVDFKSGERDDVGNCNHESLRHPADVRREQLSSHRPRDTHKAYDPNAHIQKNTNYRHKVFLHTSWNKQTKWNLQKILIVKNYIYEKLVQYL